MKDYRVFVQVSSFQSLHIEQCEHQGIHPSNAFVAKTIQFPDNLEPPDELVQAARWAADAKENEKMAVDLKVSGALGRAVILGTAVCTLNNDRRKVRYLVGYTDQKKWWWLAVNQASVAASATELTDPVVYPTPQQLIGYPTRESQLTQQRFLLDAPINDVKEYMTVTVPALLREGKLAYRKPRQPQPPTRGTTIWTERTNLEEMENE